MNGLGFLFSMDASQALSLAAFCLTLLLILASYLYLFVATSLDARRVQQHLAKTGSKVIYFKWSKLNSSFGPQSSGRIYNLHYRDREDKLHEALVLTGLLTGVVLSEDRTIEPSAEGPSKVAALSAEVAQLRQRLAELEQKNQA